MIVVETLQKPLGTWDRGLWDMLQSHPESEQIPKS